MKDWYKSQVKILTKLICEEFIHLYARYNVEGDEIYALALITDDDALTTYMMISTNKSLRDIHNGIEWEANSWLQGLSDDNDKFGVRAFTPIIIDYYENQILNELNSNSDYEEFFKENIEFYIYCLSLAKKELIEKLGKKVSNIVFFISIIGNPEVEIDSAKQINDNSEMLNNFLRYRGENSA